MLENVPSLCDFFGKIVTKLISVQLRVGNFPGNGKNREMIIFPGKFQISNLKELFFSYHNPHGFTSIQYAANISTESVPSEPPATASERFVRYPFLTWEPMIIFLLLTLVMVFLYESSNKKEKNN